MLMIIIGKASLKKVRKPKETPLRSAIPATVKLALAPIKVPFPPRQAPSDRAHQTGRNASSPPKLDPIPLMTGIIVATKGMLSMKADSSAEAQSTSREVAV